MADHFNNKLNAILKCFSSFFSLSIKMSYVYMIPKAKDSFINDKYLVFTGKQCVVNWC